MLWTITRARVRCFSVSGRGFKIVKICIPFLVSVAGSLCLGCGRRMLELYSGDDIQNQVRAIYFFDTFFLP